MTESAPSKLEILLKNAEMRRSSIEDYQINIDNYNYAVNDINENFKDDPEMQTFKKRLEELLITEKREQGKDKIILRALEAQIAQLNQQPPST